jgi:hypothetical protein
MIFDVYVCCVIVNNALISEGEGPEFFRTWSFLGVGLVFRLYLV